jgi:hypothetical protein
MNTLSQEMTAHTDGENNYEDNQRNHHGARVQVHGSPQLAVARRRPANKVEGVSMSYTGRFRCIKSYNELA